MAETIIQEDMTVQGNMVAKEGTISIAGKVAGDIDAKSVEIREHGAVNGGVSAEKVMIAGLLEGSVKCEELSLEEKSSLKADVSAGTMKMNSGAKISGRVEARGG